jgi:hypothetical protein
MNIWCLWAILVLHLGQLIASSLAQSWAFVAIMLGFVISDLGFIWLAQR